MTSSIIAQVQAAGLDTGINNTQDLLLKVVGVAVILIGATIIFASRKGKFSNVIGTVAIVVVGLSIVVLGIGFATSGKKVGQTVLTFFGF
jgi:predicted phage tail protein